MKLTAVLCLSLITTLSSFSWAQKIPSPAGNAPAANAPSTATPNQEAAKSDTMGTIKKARVFFIEPKDGATVPTKVKIKMGVEGMEIRPAGEAVDEVTSGHHHITIDAPPLAAGQPVPTDDKHIHFGTGQTEAELILKPGKHRLTLQFADGAHRSFGPALSQTITVTVK